MMKNIVKGYLEEKDYESGPLYTYNSNNEEYEI